jgi:hypothetical protein
MDNTYLNRLMDDVELAEEPFNILEGMLIGCGIGLGLWFAVLVKVML